MRKLSRLLQAKTLDPKFAILVLVALIISLIALLTPAWMVAELTDENLKIIQGLWLSCNTKTNASIICVTLFGHPHHENDFEGQLHLLQLTHHVWHTVVLLLIVMSLLCALAALIIFCFTRSATRNFRHKELLPSLFGLITFAAGVLSAVGCVIYAFFTSFNASDVSSDGLERPHNEWKGASFYAAAFSALIYLITTLILIATHLKQANSDIQEKSRVNFDPKLTNELTSDRVTPRRKKTPYPMRYSIA